MASKIVTKLVVESREYESKIDRARSGLLHMEEACRKVDGTLAVLEKEEKQFIESLGKMQTVSKTTQGRIGELTKAFTDLSAQYNRLTQEEKNGDFGKALRSSLDQLKTRIIDTKNELKGIQGEIQPTSSLFEQLSSKLGVNIGQLGAWGVALAAGKVALDTAKNAMESLEVTHDMYARTVQECEGVTTAFYTSLANCDFTNFLNGMQSIIDKAEEAYNALDDFESFSARFNPKQQVLEGDIQTKLQQARAAKAQGDEKKAKELLDEANKKIEELKKITKDYGEKQSKSGYAEIRSQVKNNSNGRIKLTNKQIDYYVDPKNWDEINKKAEKYKQLLDDAKADMMGGVRVASATEEAKLKAAKARATLAKDKSLERAFTYLNVRDSGDSAAAARWNQAHQNIYGNQLANQRIESLKARTDRMDGTLEGKSGSDKSAKQEKTRLQEINAEIAKLENAYVKANDTEKASISAKIQTLDNEKKQIEETIKALHGKGSVKVESGESLTQLQILEDQLKTVQNSMKGYGQGTEEWKMMNEEAKSLAEQIATINGNPLKPVTTESLGLMGILQDQLRTIQASMSQAANADEWAAMNEELMSVQQQIDRLNGTAAKNRLKKAGEDTQAAWQGAASAIGSVGSALQAIDDPTAKIAGLIAQAIANIAATFAASLKGTVTPWDWIAGAAAGTATMISTIAGIKSATAGAYADGGVIGGNSYSGDRLYARVNSGETILNQDQAQRALDMMDSSPVVGGGGGQSELHAETIVMAINNWGRRTGRGEVIK